MHNFAQKANKQRNKPTPPNRGPGPCAPPDKGRPWGGCGFFRKYLQRLENKKASARGSKLGHRKACARRFTSPWAVGARPGRFVCSKSMCVRNPFPANNLEARKTARNSPSRARVFKNRRINYPINRQPPTTCGYQSHPPAKSRASMKTGDNYLEPAGALHQHRAISEKQTQKSCTAWHN
jgi:hypothetical protein